MDKRKIMRLYEESGLCDYKLRSQADLFYIHDVRIDQIQGYAKLQRDEKKTFREFLINFFNAQFLFERDIVPIKVFSALEKIYVVDTKDICNLMVKKVIFDTRKIRPVSLWEFERFKGVESRLKTVEKYLRFEYLKGGIREVVHVTSEKCWH